MKPLKIDLIPAFQDNYIFAIQSQNSNHIIVVDPGDAKPVLEYCHSKQLILESIWLTHHHADHIGGVAELKQKTKARIYGPIGLEKHGIDVDQILDASQKVFLDQIEFQILDIPGHTAIHIAFYQPEYGVLFCGDTLFSLGCGRIFDGSVELLFQSLQKIKSLPLETKIYCTHEYTLRNCQFHQWAFPQLPYYNGLQKQISDTRAQGIPSIPSTLEFEKLFNQFLKTDDLSDFRQLRELRNSF